MRFCMCVHIFTYVCMHLCMNVMYVCVCMYAYICMHLRFFLFVHHGAFLKVVRTSWCSWVYQLLHACHPWRFRSVIIDRAGGLLLTHTYQTCTYQNKKSLEKDTASLGNCTHASHHARVGTKIALRFKVWSASKMNVHAWWLGTSFQYSTPPCFSSETWHARFQSAGTRTIVLYTQTCYHLEQVRPQCMTESSSYKRKWQSSRKVRGCVTHIRIVCVDFLFTATCLHIALWNPWCLSRKVSRRALAPWKSGWFRLRQTVSRLTTQLRLFAIFATLLVGPERQRQWQYEADNHRTADLELRGCKRW